MGSATSLARASTLNCMRKEVEIVNKLGLHARPAALFVRCVIRFKSKITICKGDENFSAARILEVLSADLDCGAHVVLEAIGPDEQEALNQLEALLLRFRDEEDGSGRFRGVVRNGTPGSESNDQRIGSAAVAKSSRSLQNPRNLPLSM